MCHGDVSADTFCVAVCHGDVSTDTFCVKGTVSYPRGRFMRSFYEVVL